MFAQLGRLGRRVIPRWGEGEGGGRGEGDLVVLNVAVITLERSSNKDCLSVVSLSIIKG